MTLSDRDRRALKLGAGALAVLGVYFLGIEPLAARYAALAAEHHQAASAVARHVRESRRLAALEQRVKTWEEKAGPLVPERAYSEQITAVSSQIITAAGQNQVQLQGATPGAAAPWVDRAGGDAPAAAEPRLEQATIHIDAQAGWENVFKFIASLYQIGGVLSVEQLELSSDPKQGGQLKVRLAVSVLMKAPAEGRIP